MAVCEAQIARWIMCPRVASKVALAGDSSSRYCKSCPSSDITLCEVQYEAARKRECQSQ